VYGRFWGGWRCGGLGYLTVAAPGAGRLTVRSGLLINVERQGFKNCGV
jgi:hypothetical protein